jgi:hypothetical protein
MFRYCPPLRPRIVMCWNFWTNLELGPACIVTPQYFDVGDGVTHSDLSIHA